jgi:CRISPR-associated protein Cas5h
MSTNEAVIFDIWSTFAYFRKPYTTKTALTFNLIPRSAIEGLIAAILGIDRRDRFNKLSNSKIGVTILSEIRKIPFSTMHTHSDFWETMRNYINFKPIIKKVFHTIINLELLVNPKYRIYFSHCEHHYNELLEEKLKDHQTVYTPYLGTSTMIANFQYVDTIRYYNNKIIQEGIEISSIIPYKNNKIPNIVIEKDKIYAIEQNIPSKINEERDLISSYSALYSPKGETIKVKDKDIEIQSFVFNKDNNKRKENFVFIPS